MSTAENEVAERTEGVEIGPCVQGLIVQHLGSDAGRCSHDRTRHAKGRHGAEVEQLGPTSAVLVHVAGADIAMEQTARVQDGQRRCDVSEDCAGLPPGHRRQGP